MRVADYIAQLIADNGVSDVFMVTGGGAMHLNDALGRETRLTTNFLHHEQGCSIAAESYARLSGRMAVVNVTSGPGGINALNGVFGAYVDSIPMLIVSGQVKRETLVTSYDLPLRQLGDQEVDIVRMASPVCKLATQLDNPEDTRFVVEAALWLARNGRPGPVWIDVPIDVQSSQIQPEDQRSFDPEIDGFVYAVASETPTMSDGELSDVLRNVLAKLQEAARPVVMVGTGVRLSGSYNTFLTLIEKLGVPVATAFNAHDVLWDEHPLYVGRPGTVGDRSGNFAVQNADFVLILGCRLNIRQISYAWQSFARAAYTVMIDTDAAELNKPTLSIDLPIHANLSSAIEHLVELPYVSQPKHSEYLAWCKERQRRYPVVLPEYEKTNEPINPYIFIDKLYDELSNDDVVVTADGMACVATFQAARIKEGQRLYSNSGCASMGYELPAAIGAFVARGGKRVICLAGDGSIMMNLQELQTIAGSQLPVKLFILNNNGYSSIRQTQQNFFPDNIVGCGPESGLTFPDFQAVAKAFGFMSRRCERLDKLANAIRSTIDGDGSQMLEIILDPAQPFAPKLSSRQLDDGRMVTSPLEDLSPFLPRDELADNMLIPLEEH